MIIINNNNNGDDDHDDDNNNFNDVFINHDMLHLHLSLNSSSK